MSGNNFRKLYLLIFALVLLAGGATDTALARARVTVVNVDGPGEGFNDPTPVEPVGGNPGTTLGEQRLIAFQFAADLWGATLDSNVEIFVTAAFNPLGPNVLGSAGPTFVFRDFPGVVAPFPGAEFPATWYHSALADKRAGGDLLPGFADINAQFSSDFEFFLGLDNNPGNLPDLTVVVLHELAHGLGFANFVNEATGANLIGFTDIYSHFTRDTSLDKLWSEMSASERQASAVNFDRVVWDGSDVTEAVPSVLRFGVPFLGVNSPPAIAGTLRVGAASFGPPLGSPGITADLVLADDGVGVGTDACEALTAENAALVAGKIALIDRGACLFTVKVKNAQQAGAIAVVIADNAPGSPPSGLGGADPTITIPAVRITLDDGNTIKAELAGSPVNVTLAVDFSRRAGADPAGHALLHAPNPVQLGSSISHWDPIAAPNLLMEPAINQDLTQDLLPTRDMTLNLMRDVGWFLDGDQDGVPDITVVIDGCDSGVANLQVIPGVTLADEVNRCVAAAVFGNHGQFVSCVSQLTNELKSAGILSGAQKGRIVDCAAGAAIP